MSKIPRTNRFAQACHGITSTDDMAYVGERPWHGLGNALQDGATMEQWLVAANMQHTIRRTKLLYYAYRGQQDLRADEDLVVLIRSDNGQRLGIVGLDYQIVQPFEVLDFFRDLAANHGFKLETAGTLFGGKVYWSLAKITEAKFSGWDRVGAYVLISTSADGSRSTEIRQVTVRVVCNNTIQIAWGEHTSKVLRVSHRQRFDSQKVKKELGLVQEHFDAMCEDISHLSATKITDAAAEDFVLRLLRPTDAAIKMVNEASPDDSLQALLARGTLTAQEDPSEPVLRRPRGADTILSLYDGVGMGSARPGTDGTAWGLVNAITEYVDHHAGSRTLDNLLNRSLFGDGQDLKVQAFQAAVAEFC